MTFSIPKLAAIGTIALMTPARALAEWIPVATTSTQMIYIEPESLVRDGQYTSFWERYVSSTPDANGVAALDTYKTVDCTSGNWLRQQTIGLLANGKILFSLKPDISKAKVFPSEPGTVGELVYESACNLKSDFDHWEHRSRTNEAILNMFKR